MWEVAGDEGVAHELAVGGDGGEEFEAIGEARGDLADVRYSNLPVNRRYAIGFGSFPKSVAGQVSER